MYKPQAVVAGEKTCWRFTNEQVEHSPSRLDGMPWEDEQRLRLAGCAHILETVRLVLEYSNRAIAPAMRTSSRVTERRMRLPCSTACVLFNRFFTRQSFARHDRFVRWGGQLGCACSPHCTPPPSLHLLPSPPCPLTLPHSSWL